MKKIAIVLTALAGILFMSGCAYDYYPHYYGHYVYAHGYGRPYYNYHHAFGYNSLGWDCVDNWSPIYCRA